MRIITLFHFKLENFLARPALFTVGFGGASVAACAVWQYENMRDEAMKTKMRSFGLGWGDSKLVHTCLHTLYNELLFFVGKLATFEKR